MAGSEHSEGHPFDTPRWAFRRAIGMYEFITKCMVQGLWDMLVFTSERTGPDVGRELRRLGITRPCRAPDTLASGLQILVDDAGTIRRMIVPVWQQEGNTGIVLQFESSPKRWGGADLTLGFVGAAADAPVFPGRVAEAELRAGVDAYEADMRQRAQQAATRFEELQHRDPDVPDEVRPVVTALLTAVLEGRFEDAWQLGEGRGITPDVMERVLQQVDVEVWPPPDPSEIDLILPSRGLPGNTIVFECADGTGYNLEIPIWCAQGQTDLWLIVVVSRHPGRLSAYLYDILDLE